MGNSHLQKKKHIRKVGDRGIICNILVPRVNLAFKDKGWLQLLHFNTEKDIMEILD